jgi:hypothetical protein
MPIRTLDGLRNISAITAYIIISGKNMDRAQVLVAFGEEMVG